MPQKANPPYLLSMRRLLWLPLLALAAMAVPQAAPKAPKLVFVFLTKGDVKAPADQAEREAMQKAHLGNFGKQFEAKKLIAAGPVQDPTQMRRGIVILTVDEEKEVPTLFKEDPFVRNGIMKIDAGLWHADRAGIHEDKIDPNGLEENRIVVLTAEKPLSDEE